VDGRACSPKGEIRLFAYRSRPRIHPGAIRLGFHLAGILISVPPLTADQPVVLFDAAFAAPAIGSVSTNDDGGVIRARSVSIDRHALALLASGGATRARLPLFEDAEFDLEIDTADVASGTLVGRLVGVAQSRVHAIVRAEVVMIAIHAPAIGTFELVAGAAGQGMARQLDRSGTRSNCAKQLARPPETRGATCPESLTLLRGYAADDGSTVDVMVYYTSAARDAAGGVPQIEARIDLATAIANQAYTDSLVIPRVRIVRKALIPYVESGDYATDLQRLVNPVDGFLDSIHPERDAFGGDLVSLWVANLNAGGAAYMLVGLGTDDDGRNCFSVMRQDNAPFETFAHELGHNFGCQHDRLTNPTGGFFNYAYGFREPGSIWRTIMAYAPGTAIYQFSNPNIIYNGPLGNPGPTGVPGDDPASSCDNVRAHNNTAWTIANFRPSLLTAAPPSRLHVRPGGTGSGDGSSWTNAMDDVQAAISAAVRSRGAVQEIWVAAGTYRPNRGVTNPLFVRTISFRLVNGVAVYGGFSGNETLLSQRNVSLNPTILTGDIGLTGDPSDNSYHVVSGSDLNATAVLDGFEIRDGNADGAAFPHDGGGGMLNICGSPTIRNCRFVNNRGRYGGAARNERGSQPRFVDCNFSGNVATVHGGGMLNHASHPRLEGCSFSANIAPNYGAVMNEAGSAAVFTTCSFSNHANPWGAAFGNFGSDPSLTDCTFSGNTATNGGGGFMAGGACAPVLDRCIFSGNAAAFGAGAYCFDGANAQFIACQFDFNSADPGGGLYVFNASPTLTGCSFTGNMAGGGGFGSGAAACFTSGGSATLSNCVFSSNHSGCCGGAVVVTGGATPAFSTCLFQSNSAGCCGGAVATFGVTAQFQRCRFVANAANFGGAMWNADPSSPRIDGCGFFGNDGAFGGGALHASNGCAPIVTSSVLSGNRSLQGFGGAAYNLGGSAPTYANCSMSRNSATFGAGGIWSDASSCQLANSIAWENSGPGGTDQPAQLTIVNGGTAIVNYSYVQGWTGSLGGVGNSATAPQFVDPLGADNVLGTIDDDLRLMLTSPAIDSGNNSLVPAGATLDVAGLPRFVDAPCVADSGVGPLPVVDRGAHEFQPIAAVLGDTDGNGVVNAADVPLFAAVLLGTLTTQPALAASDCNCDGVANGRDMQPFVVRLLAP